MLNTYAYVGGNPVSRVDPLGLEDFECWAVEEGRTVFGCPRPKSPSTRSPDYIKLSVGYYVGTGSITLSRNGKVYGSGGLRKSYPQPLNAGISLAAGWMVCPKPGSDKQDRFHTGPGISTVSGYRAVGGGVTWSPGEGASIELGVGAGVSMQGLDPKAELGGDMGYELYDTGQG